MGKRNDEGPSQAEIAAMLQRMAKAAADSEAAAGRHDSSAHYDQLAAKYRDAVEPE